jgi:hypothetical protein
MLYTSSNSNTPADGYGWQPKHVKGLLKIKKLVQRVGDKLIYIVKVFSTSATSKPSQHS